MHAEMLRQFQEHIKELGQRYYAGEAACVDEFLQLYCVEREARADIKKTTQASHQAEIAAAVHAMRAYARENPRHEYKGRMQDPNGVHAWLARNDQHKLDTAKATATEAS
jgi:hypothetical protein